MVERRPEEPGVVGPIPTLGTIKNKPCPGFIFYCLTLNKMLKSLHLYSISMKYFFYLLLILIALPSATSAALPYDVYADAAYNVSNQVYRPNNIFGAPDEIYADFLAKDASIILDMGEDEEGQTGNFYMHYKLLYFGAGYWVEFMDSQLNVLQKTGNNFPLNSTKETVAYTGTTPYRYIRITDTAGTLWKLDAVEAEKIKNVIVTPIDTTATTTTPKNTNTTRGMLVKLPDDGNPATTYDAAVYVIGAGDVRHAFPNETVFLSWYKNFDDVVIFDQVSMANFPLGKNVTMRPGTNLIKLQTDPKVYAVEIGGVLRPISTEFDAITLYGSQWAQRVVDMPDVFFSNYTTGEPLTSAAHANGTLGLMPSGEVVYIKNSTYYSIPGEIYLAMRFNSEFQILISEIMATSYKSAGQLTDDLDIRHPY